MSSPISIYSDIFKIFEKELRRSLQTQTPNYGSESVVLLSEFKSHDNLNTGYINKAQWINSFIKIGLTGFSDTDLGFLFDYYDSNRTGLINYKQFSLFLLNPNNHFTRVIAQTPGTVFHTQTSQYFDKVLHTLRSRINTQRGMTYYLLLEIMFKSSYRMIHYDTFVSCLKSINISTGIRDVKDFFALIDANESQWVSIDYMMKMIRGQLSSNRLGIVKDCYKKIDIENKGMIDINQLYSMISMKEGCILRSSEYIKRDVIENFQRMILIFSQWKSIQYITIDDFFEFFEGISASIENDDDFNEIINVIWTPSKNNWGNNNIKKYIGRQLSKSNEIIINSTNLQSRTPSCLFKLSNNEMRRNSIDHYSQKELMKNFDANKEHFTPIREFNKMIINQKRTPMVRENNMCFEQKKITYINNSAINGNNTIGETKCFSDANQVYSFNHPQSRPYQMNNNSFRKGSLNCQPNQAMHHQKLLNNNISNEVILPDINNNKRFTPMLNNHSQSIPNIKDNATPLMPQSLSSNFQPIKEIYPNNNPNTINTQQLNKKSNDISTEAMNKLRHMLNSYGEKGIFGSTKTI